MENEKREPMSVHTVAILGLTLWFSALAAIVACVWIIAK